MYYMDEAFELALHICGLEDNDENYENTDKVDEILYEKYGIEDADKFNQLATDLLNLIDVGRSPLTDTLYKGFSNGEGWLMKKEVPAKVSA